MWHGSRHRLPTYLVPWYSFSCSQLLQRRRKAESLRRWRVPVLVRCVVCAVYEYYCVLRACVLVCLCAACLCVFYYFYPSTSSTTSVRVDSPILRERCKCCGHKTTSYATEVQQQYFKVHYSVH